MFFSSSWYFFSPVAENRYALAPLILHFYSTRMHSVKRLQMLVEGSNVYQQPTCVHGIKVCFDLLIPCLPEP